MKFEHIIKDGQINLDLLTEALTEANQEGVDYHIFWGNVIAVVNNYLQKLPQPYFSSEPITPDAVDKFATDRFMRDTFAMRFGKQSAIVFRFYEDVPTVYLSSVFNSLGDHTWGTELGLSSMGEVALMYRFLTGKDLQ